MFKEMSFNSSMLKFPTYYMLTDDIHQWTK